jgi:hypothetical protein
MSSVQRERKTPEHELREQMFALGRAARAAAAVLAVKPAAV